MTALEKGAMANLSEGRRVGHYWLRDPTLAPTTEIREAIENALAGLGQLATDLRQRENPKAILVIGIGGSVLGPQLLADALNERSGLPAPRFEFLDNTDPDGMERVFRRLHPLLPDVICIVTSKSGGTPETRNGMVATQHVFRQAGVPFSPRAVAITCKGSKLDRLAREEGWRATIPIWDWVGGRTSITSAVGLLPLALMGGDVKAFLEGARFADVAGRSRDLSRNPAAVLAASWHLTGQGRGCRNMVVLPYCDRLALFGRYLQQLVMESLGKGVDRNGARVSQGLTVYGNKGSTDQHAFVQQLREGRNDFFATFIAVRRDGSYARPGGAGGSGATGGLSAAASEGSGPASSPGRGESPTRANLSDLEVEPSITLGDYLLGLMLGTREALTEQGRPSMLISLPEVNERSLGALIAVFERAVSLYAELINVNAYDQPGVEAGKAAAKAVLSLQTQVLALLQSRPGEAMTAEAIATQLHRPDQTEAIDLLLEHQAANAGRGIEMQEEKGVRRFNWMARATS